MTEQPSPYRCILDRKFIIENICITCSQDGKCDYQSIYPVPVCATVDTVERYFETLHSDSCASHSAFNTTPEGAAPESEWKPSPPGDTISDIMEERGISRFKLGCLLKLREQSVSDLLSGNCPIDNDMAFRLSEVLGSTPDFWDNREQIYRRELRESTNDYHDAAIRKDEREKVLEELHVALHTIPIMLVGPGVIFAPTINYIDAVVIRSLRQPKQKKEVPK